MKQKVVLFVSLVCFAQLGVTLTRELSKSFSTNTSLERRFSTEIETVLSQITSVKKKAVELLSLANHVKPNSSPNTKPSKDIDKEPQRDPFVPFYSSVAPDHPSRLAPLTSYELSQLRVSAIIGDGDGNRIASVETSSGRIFILKPGTPIGKNGGSVHAITSHGVLVSEPTSKNLLSRETKASITEISLTKANS
jgi:Tfp pilus assembly protein PilP